MENTVTIPVEEYKELLCLKIKNEMEALYRSTIESQQRHIAELESNVDFWFKKCMRNETKEEEPF